MRRLLSLFILLFVLCFGLLTTLNAQTGTTTVTYTYTYSGFPIPIPVNSADIAVIVGATVSRSITISKVTASVQVNYPYVGDLNVYMYSPNGTRVKLLERNCEALKNIDTSFDDAASSAYKDFCPSEAGRGPYSGNEPLSNFNGQNGLGIWTLAVETNGSDSRSGSVVGLSVTITGTAQTAAIIAPGGIRNFASPTISAQPMAPGEVISVFGLNLGPQEGVSAGSSFWPTWADGTVVRINGQDSPMRYIAFYRIDVQVPTGLDLSKNAKVSVFRGSLQTNEVEVAVASTSPAIYTTNLAGTGQATATNADGTANSKTNAAAKGSSITVYANGLGVTDPATGPGYPAPSEPTLTPVAAISARIGGVAAELKKATLAPGQIGVYALELTVPNSVKTGTAEVIITSGETSSQNGVTIEVK